MSAGDCLTPSIGESPSEEKESTLSEVLEVIAPPKYSLSPTACAGILRRGEKRGTLAKKPLLKAVLEAIVKAAK